MTLTIDFDPQTEARLVEVAEKEGIEASALVKKLVDENLPITIVKQSDVPSRRKTVGDILAEVGFVEGGPGDLSTNSKYMDGLGVTKSIDSPNL